MSPPKNEKEINTDTIQYRLATKFIECISKEQIEDVADTLETIARLSPKKLAQRGLACINLSLVSMRTGLGGKNILELELDPSVSIEGQELNSGDIRTGDIVKLDKLQPSAKSNTKKIDKKGSKKDKSRNFENDDTEGDGIEGVITKVSSKSIQLAVEDKYEDKVFSLSTQDRLWVVKLANSATYKRMQFALKRLSEIQPNELTDALLGKSNPPLNPLVDVEFFDSSLNDPQKEAIKFVLGDVPVSIIHGPPGTGKTHTIIEIIRQLVKRGERVLVCGPSNISADIILERLDGLLPSDKLLRLGHPARLLTANLKHSLEIVSKTSELGDIVKDVRSDIDKNVRSIKKTRSGRERREIFQELKYLRKEYRTREKKLIGDILLDSQVVVATLHGAGSRDIEEVAKFHCGDKPLFSTIIIDEISQSLEPQCWIPIVVSPKTHKLILAGDNQQLPPTVKIEKDKKARSVMQRTLFDRLLKIHGDSIRKMLTIQYRMNSSIMEFPSKELYESKLIAADSVANRLLCDLPGVKKTDDTETPVVWIDTQGGDYPEEDVLDSSSSRSDSNTSVVGKYNQQEARIVKKYVETLISANVSPTDIGIIAPYNAQVAILKKWIHVDHPDVEISTVDGFQGREKEAIILSLVRSNPEFKVGFLDEERRLNVAITRPKRHLCVIGDMETVSHGSRFLKNYVKWAEYNSDLRYPDMILN